MTEATVRVRDERDQRQTTARRPVKASSGAKVADRKQGESADEELVGTMHGGHF